MIFITNTIRRGAVMKKTIIVLIFILSFAGYSKADDNFWINLGYSYYLPEESGAKAPTGPANLTIGGQVTDWVAIDFSIGYLWDLKTKNADTDINTMPIRLDFLIQPSFDTGMFDVLPYIGIGPQISANNTNYANNIFSYGFSAKAGVRFIENGVLFGIGAEYLYNPLEVNYNGVKNKYNASGIMFGGEVGIVF